jgi:hypothetical protein
MFVRWVVRTALGVLLLAVSLTVVGCGGGAASDNGPTEEPNVGPGAPPGLPPGVSSKPAKSSPGK